MRREVRPKERLYFIENLIEEILRFKDWNE